MKQLRNTREPNREITMDRQKYIDYFKKDRFAMLTGIEVVDFGPGWATVRMTIRDDHRNALGMVQGGALFTLADLAFAVAGNSHGTVAVGIQASINFVNPGQNGVLTAKAREVTRNHRLGTYIVEITDEQGIVLASFQGTGYRKDKPLDIES